MLRTLSGRLAAAMLVLILVISIVFVGLSIVVTRLQFQEVNQSLGRTLAADVIADTPWLMRGHDVNQDAFKGVFDRLMHVNPSIEIYLLDPDGQIMAFSAPPGRVKRQRVGLSPIQAFLNEDQPLPIRGDDPRDAGRSKVFSAAPLFSGGALQGYLYIVLGGEAHDSVVDLFQTSFVMRLGAGLAIAAVLLSLLAGFISFKWLTRRLRYLAKVMDNFRASDLRQASALLSWRRDGGDEIDRLGETFEHMSQRIADQIGQLQEADTARRELMANISHDLRTPMASLQGYLETLQIKADDLSSAERRHYLELATKHSRHLSRLTDELFQLARLDQPDPSLEAEPFSVAELAHDVAQKFRLEIEQKGLSLKTDIPVDAPFVSGDIGLIERVFDNLLDNAIKYTPAGGTLNLALRPKDGVVETSITDTGCGIPVAVQPRIFDRFYRVRQHTEPMAEGTGLGLAIAKRILELHGSPLKVRSKPGTGATFTFQLPVSAT